MFFCVVLFCFVFFSMVYLCPTTGLWVCSSVNINLYWLCFKFLHTSVDLLCENLQDKTFMSLQIYRISLGESSVIACFLCLTNVPAAQTFGLCQFETDRMVSGCIRNCKPYQPNVLSQPRSSMWLSMQYANKSKISSVYWKSRPLLLCPTIQSAGTFTTTTNVKGSKFYSNLHMLFHHS